MDLQNTTGLLGFREQCFKELRAREKWLKTHGKLNDFQIKDDDIQLLRDLERKRKEKEKDRISIETLREDPKKISKGNFARFVGSYNPVHTNAYKTANMNTYKEPKWDNKIDEEFLDTRKKNNRKKNWLTVYFRELARHENLMKKAYGRRKPNPGKDIK